MKIILVQYFQFFSNLINSNSLSIQNELLEVTGGAIYEGLQQLPGQDKEER